MRERMENVALVVLSDDRAFADRISAMIGGGSSAMVTAIPLAQITATPLGGHIVILDAHLNGAIGLCEVLSATASVLFVGAADDDDWAQRALESGACGVVPDGGEARDLARAVEVIAGGGVWARRRWISAALRRLVSALREPGLGFESLLSSREREVCRCAVLGFSNKEVATRLTISEATVKAHLSHIFHKLGVQKRSQLAAAYHGFVRLSGARDHAGRSHHRPPAAAIDHRRRP